MKKFLGMFLSLILSLSLFSSYTIFAQDNTKYLMKESSVQQISKDGNIIINNESYIVSNSQLKNSIFEGERVVVQSDGIYVNGTRASDQVQVTIGGVVVGWIIDGIMMYAVGYNGAQLAASTISMIVSFCAAHPGGAIIIAVVLLTVTASSIQQYTTSTGNVCVKTGRNYACKYGLETDKPVED